MTAQAPSRSTQPHVRQPRFRLGWVPRARSVYKLVTTTDHKVIGMMYVVACLVFFLVGGLMALLMRTELALPGLQFLPNEQYNQLFTMHGTVMLPFYATPIVFGSPNSTTNTSPHLYPPRRRGESATTAGDMMTERDFGQILTGVTAHIGTTPTQCAHPPQPSSSTPRAPRVCGPTASCRKASAKRSPRKRGATSMTRAPVRVPRWATSSACGKWLVDAADINACAAVRTAVITHQPVFMLAFFPRPGMAQHAGRNRSHRDLFDHRITAGRRMTARRSHLWKDLP